MKKLLMSLLILVPASVVMTLVVLYSQNSLYSNNQWVVQKRMTEMGLNGSDEYLLTRVPLVQNVLNLGQYFGYQGIFLKDQVLIQQFQVEFKIEKEAYLDIIYNYQKNHLSGIRLSRRLDTPSIVYESDGEGKFLSKQSVSAVVLSEGWHQASFSQNSSGKILLNIDKNSQIVTLNSDYKIGQIGFRAGLEEVFIRSVDLQTEQGKWLNYSFRHTKNWQHLFFLNLVGLFLFGTLISVRSMGSLFSQGRQALFFWMTLSLVTTFCALGWYGFDFFYYSFKVPTQTGITQTLFHENDVNSYSLEEIRYALFRFWFKAAGGEEVSRQGVAERGYPMNRIWRGPIYCRNKSECVVSDSLNNLDVSGPLHGKSYHVIFVGSSQTIGAGAVRLEDTFFVRQQRQLVELLPKSIELESLNIAISGANSTELLQEYKSIYSKFQPDVVVINMAHNDIDHDVFFLTIGQFLEMNQFLGIRTVLIQEPNSSEYRQTYSLFANYEKLRLLAEKYRVPLYKAYEYFASVEIRLSGQVWSDEVHLTSYGQKVMADWLVPKILKEFKSIKPQKHANLKLIDK